MDYALSLPNGSNIPGKEPIVVVGPNGSGKTRKTRELGNVTEFVNALRNTRVAPDLPTMGVDQARNNLNNQKAQARGQHWEMSTEFDSLLAQLLAQHSVAAMDFMRNVRTGDGVHPPDVPVTVLSQVEEVWKETFPGREISWDNWRPTVSSAVLGETIRYSGNYMSDGEKAALYLAGRVLSADPGILVVDEPETHLHSLLAIKLWNSLEAARPDIRFVYVTHDLTFALSRRDARFVLADPFVGLRLLELNANLPDDIREALLGSASLSFYASRVVFCEGEEESRDRELYEAWFAGQDTVVRPVGSCDRVIRCVDASLNGGVTSGLEAVGLVDADYRPTEFSAKLPPGVRMLSVHEVESLACLPSVLLAVADYLGKPVEEQKYLQSLNDAVSDRDRELIVIERWKQRMHGRMESILTSVTKKNFTPSQLAGEMTSILDQANWKFSPKDFLTEEEELVNGADAHKDISQFLRVVPGKQLMNRASASLGMSVESYWNLLISSLGAQKGGLHELGSRLEAILVQHLPPRYTKTKIPVLSPI